MAAVKQNCFALQFVTVQTLGLCMEALHTDITSEKYVRDPNLLKRAIAGLFVVNFS